MYRYKLKYYLALAVIFQAITPQILANENNSINVERSACINEKTHCQSAYTFLEVADYVNVFEEHDNTVAKRARIRKNIKLGPNELKRRDIIHFNVEGELIGIMVNGNRKIAGLAVRKKMTYPVHYNGALAAVELSSGQLVNNVFYPHSSYLTFDINGQVLSDSFYPETAITEQDEQNFKEKFHTVRSSYELAGLTVGENSKISVDVQGNIQSIILKSGQWHSDLYYPPRTQLVVDENNVVKINHLYDQLASKDERVEFEDQLGIQLLQKPLVLGDVVFPKNTMLQSNRFSFTAAHMFSSINVCGIPMKKGETVGMQAWSDDTYSLYVSLKHEVEIQGLRIKKGQVRFRDDCSLEEATLATNQVVDDFTLSSTEKFKLDNDGNLISGTTGADVSIWNITLSKDIYFSRDPRYSKSLFLGSGGFVTDGDREYVSATVSFYEDGVISSGKITKPAIIDGKKYERNTKLEFSPGGEVISAKVSVF